MSQTTTSAMAAASVAEELDFSFNLLAARIRSLDMPDPATGDRLLKGMCEFVARRYAGQSKLAVETLLSLGDLLDDEDWPNRQRFWDRLEWLSQRTGGQADLARRKRRYWGSV